METRESHNFLYNSTREFLLNFDSTSCAPPNNLGGMPRSGKFCFIVCVCVDLRVLGVAHEVCYVFPTGGRGSRLVGQTLQF